MKKLIALLISGFPLFSTPLSAHEDVNFEYICSVTQKNSEGRFTQVVNVVFLPDWQKKSHLWKDETKNIWFEIVPVKNGMGEIEKYEMVLTLLEQPSTEPAMIFYGPQFSEIGFQNFQLNIAAHCFHRSQRGR